MHHQSVTWVSGLDHYIPAQGHIGALGTVEGHNEGLAMGVGHNEVQGEASELDHSFEGIDVMDDHTHGDTVWELRDDARHSDWDPGSHTTPQGNQIERGKSAAEDDMVR